MPRTPAKAPPNAPRKISAINQVTAMTSDAMAERILQLAKNHEKFMEQRRNIASDLESKLPAVTVSLLADVRGEARADMAKVARELSEAQARAQLERADENILRARIDRLESENATLIEAKRLLEREQKQGANKAKQLKEKDDALQEKYDILRRQLASSEGVLKSLFQRLADPPESGKSTTPESNLFSRKNSRKNVTCRKRGGKRNGQSKLSNDETIVKSLSSGFVEDDGDEPEPPADLVYKDLVTYWKQKEVKHTFAQPRNCSSDSPPPASAGAVSSK